MQDDIPVNVLRIHSELGREERARHRAQVRSEKLEEDLLLLCKLIMERAPELKADMPTRAVEFYERRKVQDAT